MNTIRNGRFVCGGGWSERPEDRFIKFKAICCLVLFFGAAFVAPIIADSVGMWSLLAPIILFVASLILFRFERPRVWWGLPDSRMPRPDQAAHAEQKAPAVPEYDPHNLY